MLKSDYDKQYRHINREKIKQYAKKYRVNNKEKLKEYNKKYREINKETIKNKKEQYIKINKEHIRENKKKYRENNKSSISEKKRKYAENNKEKIRESRKKYRTENKDIIKERKRIYREQNKEKVKLAKQKYYENNKCEILKKQKEYSTTLEYKIKRMERFCKRYHSDIVYRLTQNIRTRIWTALKRDNIKKQNKTLDLIGCSIIFLKQYLESKFLSGMTWENHGMWHIDHIIPCASFDLTNIEQQKQCFHYTNLQPLWAIDNIKKGAKMLYNIQTCSQELISGTNTQGEQVSL